MSGRIGNKNITSLIRAYGNINPATVVRQAAALVEIEKDKLDEEQKDIKLRYQVGGKVMGDIFTNLKEFREAQAGGFEGGFGKWIFGSEENAKYQEKGKLEIEKARKRLEDDPYNTKLQEDYHVKTSLFPKAAKKQFPKKLKREEAKFQREFKRFERKENRQSKREARREDRQTRREDRQIARVDRKFDRRFGEDWQQPVFETPSIENESFDMNIDDSGFYDDFNPLFGPETEPSRDRRTMDYKIGIDDYQPGDRFPTMDLKWDDVSTSRAFDSPTPWNKDMDSNQFPLPEKMWNDPSFQEDLDILKESPEELQELFSPESMSLDDISNEAPRMEGWGNVASSIGSIIGANQNEDLTKEEKLTSQLPALIQMFSALFAGGGQSA